MLQVAMATTLFKATAETAYTKILSPLGTIFFYKERAHLLVMCDRQRICCSFYLYLPVTKFNPTAHL